MVYRFKITQHQADAIRLSGAKAHALNLALQAKLESDKDYTDAMVRDAGYRPEEFDHFQLAQEGDATFMVLIPKKSKAEINPEVRPEIKPESGSAG